MPALGLRLGLFKLLKINPISHSFRTLASSASTCTRCEGSVDSRVFKMLAKSSEETARLCRNEEKQRCGGLEPSCERAFLGAFVCNEA